MITKFASIRTIGIRLEDLIKSNLVYNESIIMISSYDTIQVKELKILRSKYDPSVLEPRTMTSLTKINKK